MTARNGRILAARPGLPPRRVTTGQRGGQVARVGGHNTPMRAQARRFSDTPRMRRAAVLARRARPYRLALQRFSRQTHGRGWYTDRYHHIAHVGHSHYYLSEGYWFPAFGYDPGVITFAYNAPIFSYNELPPDDVVVNVQNALAEQGYFNGEADGNWKDDLTEAIAQYQEEHDLEVTMEIDEATVTSLGLRT